MLASARSIILSTLAAAAVVTMLPSNAAASTNSVRQCEAGLEELDDSKSALQGLQASVESATTGRVTLQARAAEIREALASATTPERAKLRKQGRRIADQLATIEVVLPPILAQATALAEQVDAAEREYLVCIERSIDR